MRSLLLTAVTGAAIVVAASTADSAPAPAGHASQCFTRSEVSGFARHDARSAVVRVDNDRVYPLTAVGSCALFEKPGMGLSAHIGRAQLVSRSKDWFCPGDTADLLPWNTTGADRCAVTVGPQLRSR